LSFYQINMERPNNFQSNLNQNIRIIENNTPLRETSAGDIGTSAVQSTTDFSDRLSANERFLDMARLSNIRAFEQPASTSGISNQVVLEESSIVDPEAEEPYVAPSFAEESRSESFTEVTVIDDVPEDFVTPTPGLNNASLERIGFLIRGDNNPTRQDILSLLSHVEAPGVRDNTADAVRTITDNDIEARNIINGNTDLATHHQGIMARLSNRLEGLDLVVRAHPFAFLLGSGLFIVGAVGGIWYFSRRAIGGLGASVPVSVSTPINPTINPTINITSPPQPPTSQPGGGIS